MSAEMTANEQTKEIHFLKTNMLAQEIKINQLIKTIDIMVTLGVSPAPPVRTQTTTINLKKKERLDKEKAEADEKIRLGVVDQSLECYQWGRYHVAIVIVENL
jgi:hypothetical protein